MKITPLDIRQKTFEKQIRGYDKEEVAAFLTYLSQEWEKIVEERNLLQLKFDQADKEAQKLRDIEQSLFKTLKTAEDTGANIIEHANKTADLILKEAHMNADLLESDAKSKARSILEQAESRSKGIVEDVRDEVKKLTEAYEALLSQREFLLKNLKSLAADTLENTRLNEGDFRRADFSISREKVKDLLERAHFQTEKPLFVEEEEEMELIVKPEIPDQERFFAEEDEPPQMLENTEDAIEEVNEENLEEASPEEKPEEEKEESNSKKDKQSGSFFDQFD